ncbi:hypothetical protein SUC37_08810 [Streptococcus agalactiae]|uniref:hypothetical protein n=2 Tax=Streptococcus agalactiae TaxID=1311 RepID=UPI00101365A6|nr:hypothetical protein [Streptococcus agalactiae]KAF1107521.1 hypothetical protein B8V09_04510 [Streptococcus agalactiae]KAF1137497.1 hypothetical protein B8V14_09495 [Streptococcus agalactiae]KAF1143901.1 hypothetical protein B8V13_06985 [Streptococcus agalactiae]KAF1166340.1 hypothetical protein B8V22_05990 [Streptococcus agalactiae]KAF1185758.1 hypothetical protein B8V27_10415 [Streptococcus agalactiae]
MNIKEKIVVLRKTEDGSFLKGFKNRDVVLAYNMEFTNIIQAASFLPEESYNMQKDEIDNLAETFGCDVVVIEASHDLKFIDGESVPELTKEQKIKSMVNGMFEQVFGGE